MLEAVLRAPVTLKDLPVTYRGLPWRSVSSSGTIATGPLCGTSFVFHLYWQQELLSNVTQGERLDGVCTSHLSTGFPLRALRRCSLAALLVPTKCCPRSSLLALTASGYSVEVLSNIYAVLIRYVGKTTAENCSLKTVSLQQCRIAVQQNNEFMIDKSSFGSLIKILNWKSMSSRANSYMGKAQLIS